MTFTQDSTYYHTYVKFELLRETAKAYLLCIKGLTIWVPKKLCKSFTKNSAYIYTEVLEKNLSAARMKSDTWKQSFGSKNENTIIKEKIINLNNHQLKSLISLCHPDKHNNSKTATDITVMLLKKR